MEPICRVFIPTPHQNFEAYALLKSLEYVMDVPLEREPIFVKGCLLNNKYHYGGTFSWDTVGENEYRLAYDDGITDYHLSSIEFREFFEAGETTAVWHPDKLKWELVSKHKSKI